MCNEDKVQTLKHELLKVLNLHESLLDVFCSFLKVMQVDSAANFENIHNKIIRNSRDRLAEI